MKVAFLLDEWGLDWTRTYNFDETCLCLSPTGSHGWWWKGANEKLEFQRPSKQAVTVTLVTFAVRAQVAAQCIFHGTTDRVVPDSQSFGVHGNSAAAVLEDGGNGERTYSWAGLCCAHGHGAYPHQCRNQTDAARGVRPHSRHHDPSTYNELLTALRCGLMRPFKSTIRRTACENYARAIYNNTDDIGIVQPTAAPDLRAKSCQLHRDRSARTGARQKIRVRLEALAKL